MLALLGAVGLVLRLPLTWKCLCLPLMWPALVWSPLRPEVGHFEVVAVDVGQGNAVLVRTAHHSLLYDTGPRYAAQSDAGQRILVPFLRQLGERIDVLMLSHRDSDHTGGAAAVLAQQPQAALQTSLEPGHFLHGLRADWTHCQRGQTWTWDGVHFEVLHPTADALAALAMPLVAAVVQPTPEGMSEGAAQQQASAPVPAPSTKPAKPVKAPMPNALSCVLRISAGTTAALLTGDIEAPQELALVHSGLQPVNWLLVPHHGSKTSSTPAFLQALRPQWAMVQAGYRNRYGHPAEPVTDRYRLQGMALVESTRCGAATWRSAEPQDMACERQQSKRYWHHVFPQEKGRLPLAESGLAEAY